MMKIKNIEKSSMVDYPPYVSCVVFLAGCNYRCPYCYNGELATDTSNLPNIPKDEFLEWLITRHGKLDAVVLSGGEPTIHDQELLDFAREIKELDFLVKLDTNGSCPKVTKTLLDQKLLDYIAMDIKSDISGYDNACGITVNMSDINDSITTIMKSGIPYEFRTTVVPSIHDENTLLNIGQMIKGAPKYAIQQFKPLNTLDPIYKNVIPFTEADMEGFKKSLEYLKTIIEIEFRR
jgi:pyruvate formate lyase activating enzyme